MTFGPAFLAVVSICLSVAAQFALKQGMTSAAAQASNAAPAPVELVLLGLRQPLVALGLGVYVLGALTWLVVLARWDVSKAYPLVGAGFALSLLCGYFAGEQVTVARAVGVLLIVAGVLTVGRS